MFYSFDFSRATTLAFQRHEALKKSKCRCSGSHLYFTIIRRLFTGPNLTLFPVLYKTHRVP